MQSLNISTAALRSIQYALDTTANNLANVDTVGYKRRGVAFSELLVDTMGEQPFTDKQRTSPPGLRIGSGVRVGMTRLDMSQGSVKITDIPTDLMIEGDGYFAVSRITRDPDTNRLREEFRLTRNGGFQIKLSPEYNQYALTTPNGDYLVDENGIPILMDKVGELTITPEGRVLNDGEEIARIGVWKVDNPDQYQQVGENEFLVPANQPITNFAFSTATIRQGALEASNVDMTREMTQLIGIQRAYQFNARAIAISDQMMGIANSLRSR
ncbi:flagellar hook-basal body protein [Brevibacillus sp. SYP-B805]|uniref:flagellar hook-basal body protein n=1 Tax=Brevibacillus sp. SYP-B805 TaxID=1578199 RepID=UPI0013EBEF3E|nr:flagellar hook-basal body protein [Brevibacillus sp. SYP-B805]NGQ95584.1 flagellar hook-basal body protein [Brevibacillus sp. SYP-B805]